MRKKFLLFLLLLLFSSLLFSDDEDEIIKKYLGRGSAKGEIFFSNSSRFNYLGAFNYFVPVYIKGKDILFLDYRHSVPLKKREGSSVFDIDHAEFKLTAGWKHLLNPSLLLNLDYRHYHLVRVDLMRLDRMDIVSAGVETPGFRLISPDLGLDFRCSLGLVVARSSELWGRGEFDASLRYNFLKLSPYSNLGVEFSLSALFSSRFDADKEGRLRLNLFSKGERVTSFYFGFIDNKHPLGLVARGVIFGVSFEEGRSAPPLAPPHTIVKGRLGISALAPGGAFIETRLGGEWRLLDVGDRFSLRTRVEGGGTILTDPYNNAFYFISGGAYLYYRDEIGFGFSFYHRSNHLIKREITNPRSSINFAEFVVLTPNWGRMRGKGGFILPDLRLGSLDFFFALGGVVDSTFVSEGGASFKYGIRYTYPIDDRLSSFVRYYGEYVSGIRLDDFEIGLLIDDSWTLSLRKLRDDEGYGKVNYLMIGVSWVF